MILSKELMSITWRWKTYKYDVPVSGRLRITEVGREMMIPIDRVRDIWGVVTQGRRQTSLTCWFLGWATRKHFTFTDKITYELSIFLSTYIKPARGILFFHWPLWKYLLWKCVRGTLKEIIRMIYLKRYREEMIDTVIYYTPIHQVSLLATGLILVVSILLQAVC